MRPDSETVFELFLTRIHSVLYGWRGHLFAILAGAVMVLAFAPFSLSLFAVIVPAVLMVLWSGGSRSTATLRGWFFGLGLFGAGTSWIHVSIHEFGGVPIALSMGLTLLFVVCLALYPALLGYLYRVLSRQAGPGGMVLLFPVVWVLVEWFRGWFLTGFPWLALGYSQIDTPLAGFAPLAGVYGVSLAVVLSSSLLLVLIGGAKRQRLIALTVLAALWLGGLGLKQVPWAQPAGEPIRVSMVQGNISQDQKWRRSQRVATMQLYQDLTFNGPQVDLMVWPESAIPLFYDRMDEAFLKPVAERLREQETDLVLGALHRDTSGKPYFNSLLVMAKSPRFFDKKHLVPFTEFLPLKGLLGGLVEFMQVPMSDFSAGSENQPLLEAAGYPFASSICYEDAFGEELIDQLPEAAYLVNVSNDAWFGTSIAPHQHLQIARMRALETGRYMLRSTNTGVSAIIDPGGEVQSRSPQFEAHVLTDTILPMKGSTPYVRVGNYPVITLSLLTLLGYIVIGFKRTRIRVQ